MFSLGLLIGLYSFVIFFLGITGSLYKPIIVLITAFFILPAIFVFREELKDTISSSINFFKNLDKSSGLLVGLIVIQSAVNLIGVLGPEIGFDALWYHLTIPKLYLINHSIFHIPGGLLYYSDIPKLTEMLFTAALSFHTEILAKFTHYLFGIFIVISIYKFSGKFMDKKFSILAGIIFYSNLVVGWESITSYVDLTRTFFEFLAFWAFYDWTEGFKKRKLILSGLMLGFAIASKLTALGSIFIYGLIFLLKTRNNLKTAVKNFLAFILLSLLVPLPWLVFSYIHTGNPVFPFLSLSIGSQNFLSLPSLNYILPNLYLAFLNLSDPSSPIYIISLPIILIGLRKLEKNVRILAVYAIAGFLVWYLLQFSSGGRFILPYLPVISILVSLTIYKLKDNFLKSFLFFLILIVSVTSIGYRLFANHKFITVISGSESKKEFLTKNLNFNFGDFYDTDGYFKKIIKSNDKVLLFGFHNLYYIDFPFVDSSWVKKGDKFNYIAVQNASLPIRFSSWNLIYQNDLSNVRLYSLDNKIWEY